MIGKCANSPKWVSLLNMNTLCLFLVDLHCLVCLLSSVSFLFKTLCLLTKPL